MKRVSNTQTKKKGGLAAAHVGSVIRSPASTAIRSTADNILVRDLDQARYADPTPKQSSLSLFNLWDTDSLSSTKAGTTRAHHGFVKNFPDEPDDLLV